MRSGTISVIAPKLSEAHSKGKFKFKSVNKSGEVARFFIQNPKVFYIYLKTVGYIDQ